MAKRYTIKIFKSAQKDLASLPQAQRKRIADVIDALADNPFPPASKRLQGELDGYFRVRMGDYRIIYQVDGGELIVVVVRVRHRRDVYR